MAIRAVEDAAAPAFGQAGYVWQLVAHAGGQDEAVRADGLAAHAKLQPPVAGHTGLVCGAVYPFHVGVVHQLLAGVGGYLGRGAAVLRQEAVRCFARCVHKAVAPLASVHHQHLAARAGQLQGSRQAGVAGADGGKGYVLHDVCSFRWWWPAWPAALCCAMRRLKSADNVARVTVPKRLSSRAWASCAAPARASFTAWATRQVGRSSRKPSDTSGGAPSAWYTSPRGMRAMSHDSTQPPPWPLADTTNPASRRPPIRRRSTTGLVCMAAARASEVAGPSPSAMCSSTCNTSDSWLFCFM